MKWKLPFYLEKDGTLGLSNDLFNYFMSFEEEDEEEESLQVKFLFSPLLASLTSALGCPGGRKCHVICNLSISRAYNRR